MLFYSNSVNVLLIIDNMIMSTIIGNIVTSITISIRPRARHSPRLTRSGPSSSQPSGARCARSATRWFIMLPFGSVSTVSDSALHLCVFRVIRFAALPSYRFEIAVLTVCFRITMIRMMIFRIIVVVLSLALLLVLSLSCLLLLVSSVFVLLLLAVLLSVLSVLLL